MDANNIQNESKELAEKLASCDQIDFDYAVNQYFEDHAQFRTDGLAASGVSQIKKLLYLNSLLKAEGFTVGQPRYDSGKQRIAFQIGNKYQMPALPSYIPFGKRFSNIQVAPIHYNLVAQLAPNGDEQGDGGAKGQKLFITKLEAKRKERFLLEGLVPYSLLRPVVTLVALFAASSLSFTEKHKGDNIIQFALAAVVAVWTATWETLMAESSKRKAQAEQWSDKKGAQFNQLYDAAMSTAARVQADLEARGKAAGIPVDDYKQRLVQAYSDISENVEARAKAAGVSVEEYKKQAQTAIDDLQRRAAAAGQQLSDAALKVQADLQARGQAAGIPFDDYRQRLVQAYADISENVEARAKAAGVSVDEYKKQAQAAIGDIQNRAAAAGQQITEAAYKIQADLEKRGKDAGIPVDDYKQRVSQAYNDLYDNVEARARAAGVPVDEYKKQLEAIIEDLKKRAEAAGQQVEEQVEEVKKSKNKKKGSKANGNGNAEPEFVPNSTEPAKSHEEIEAEFAKVPHTPLGGHDPTAPNAPSFAAAAQL